MRDINQPGIHYGVSRAEYDAIDAVNQSTIKRFVKNPRAWKQGKTESKQSPAMIWGCLFEAILFREDLNIEFSVLDSFKRLELLAQAHIKKPNAKWSKLLPEYQAWKKQAGISGKPVIDGDLIGQAHLAVSRCKDDPHIKALLDAGGNHSVMIVWRDPDSELLCKGLIDFVPDNCTHLVDVKTTSCIAGEDLEGAMRRFYYHSLSLGYHIQAGCYLDGWRLAQEQSGVDDIDEKHGWLFVVSDSAEPYPSAGFELDPEDIDAGRRIWRDGLLKYRDCTESGHWPGLTEDLGFVRLNRENFQNKKDGE